LEETPTESAKRRHFLGLKTGYSTLRTAGGASDRR